MDIIKSTANKVQELEKRLDNALIGEGLRVSEVKQEFEDELLSEEDTCFNVLTLTGGATSDEIVVQGEIKFRVHEATNIIVSLMVDGYVVYTEPRTVSPGLYSWIMIKALTIAQSHAQEMKLIIRLAGGGSASLIRYNFFLWGYGTSMTIGESATEPKIYASCENDRYNIYLSLNNFTYKCFIWDFPENLSIDDFSYYGKVKAVVPVQIPVVSPLLDYGDGEDVETPEEDPRTVPFVYNFVIDENGNLYSTFGEFETFSAEGVAVIDENVSAVTATRAESGEVVVVYAKNEEIYTFSIIDGVHSSPVYIREFNEPVAEVCLIDDCVLTTFLVVGLMSGKNYLLSSTTIVNAQDKHSTVKECALLEFL